MTIIRRSKTFETFQDLFSAVLEPVTWDNLPDVLDLFRHVHDDVNPLLALSWNGRTNDLSKLSQEQIEAYNLLTAERTLMSVQVAALLRQPGRDMTRPLDISGLGFDPADLRGADLTKAVIAPASWNLVNLDGCDLSGVIGGDNVWFYSTAWWRARRIERPFLEELKTRFPYVEGQAANSHDPLSMRDYLENLARLEAQV